MGREKERMIEAEDNWKALARKEGHRCAYCGTAIEYCDRDIYFETGRCGPCHNILEKDD